MYKHGNRVPGTLHLTPHHIIFHFTTLPPDATPETKPRARETWITYPMVNYCTYRPAPPVSRQSPTIRLRCRDFTFVAFTFLTEDKARDVYDTIRSLACKLGRIEKLYAFSYVPQPPEKELNGWELYDARRELRRMGISPKDTEKGWRITDINEDYKVWRLKFMLQM